jgi:DnaK suppressor protein
VLDEGLIRLILEESQRRLRNELQALSANGGQAESAVPQYGKRAGDHIAEALDHRRNALAGQNLQRQAGEIERALEKLDRGTYGRCDRCGEPIGEERLEALPWAVLCIACKRLQERARR